MFQIKSPPRMRQITPFQPQEKALNVKHLSRKCLDSLTAILKSTFINSEMEATGKK